jgi:mRNA-degrading endonuclease HigB of HigAB toxin-antitoxin module
MRGNRYRINVVVKDAPFFLVYVRFVGTHAEYDAVDPLTI